MLSRIVWVDTESLVPEQLICLLFAELVTEQQLARCLRFMFSTIVRNTQDIDRLQFIDLIYALDLIADQAAAVKHEPVNVRKGGGVIAAVAAKQMHTSGAQNSTAARAGRRRAMFSSSYGHPAAGTGSGCHVCAVPCRWLH